MSQHDPYKFAITDPLQPASGLQSEVKGGMVKGGKSNWFTTSNPELAAEYKKKKPWSIVAPFQGTADTHRPTFTMPGVPYYSRGEHRRFAERFNRMYRQLKEKQCK